MPSSAEEPTSARPWRIALISSSVLALELAFIREIPAEVRAISYFTNLVFMASFFGLGIGCLLERARRLDALLPLGLCVVAGFVYYTRGLVVFDRAEAVHYWLEHDKPLGVARDLPLVAVALVAFLGCALPFVALGQQLALAMSMFPRLRAYAWDIAGSLAGTIAFVAASALSVPPYVWPLLLMLAWAVWLARSWPSRALHVGAGALFLLFAQSPYPSTWSPYYYIQYREEPRGLRVWVNSSFHQYAANLDPRQTSLAEFQQRIQKKFGVPYQIYRDHHAGSAPRSVLILGAGTGNDVNIALANGAERIVAVEIDPAILELGRTRNPTRPYADPRVRAVVDDARHFLRSSSEQFDMIVFGTLDSQTLLSSQANLRLENYVYTQEAFAEVAQRLTPTGLCAAYYSVFKPWLAGRLYRTICDNFPGRCRMLTFDSLWFDTLFLAGPTLPISQADRAVAEAANMSRPSTDDWPFLYLEAPTIAAVYLQLIAVVLALIAAVLLVFRRAFGPAPMQLEFLFLGMGFTLMESAAVVRLALLFGSTWVVNAVVFSAVLGMVALGNYAVQRGRVPGLQPTMLLLLSAVALNYLFSPALLVGLPAAARLAACAILIGAPVFFAAVCFSLLFARQPATGLALGFNLIGAMAGGFAEYLSMLLGMSAVWLIVFVVYLYVWLCTLRSAPASAQ